MKIFHRRKTNFFKNVFKSSINSGRPDYVLLITFSLIILFGLIMLSSVSVVESFQKFGNNYYLFWHQLTRGFLPGLVIFLILSKIDYNRLLPYTVLFFIASLILLLLVFIPGLGVTYSKAQSWINIGSFSFQPAEIVKLFLILSLSGWFAQRGKEMNQDFWNGLVPFIIILGLICLLIVLQPDLGTLVIVATIAFIIYFVAGGKIIHIISLGFMGLGAIGILIAQAPYRAARLMTFLYPELDPQGIGYHINQAFLAIGSGGWFGLGFGQSRQKFAYLPEAIGDSIFAIIAEELGFIFSFLLILLFIILLFHGLKLSQRVSDDYGRYLSVGIVSWFTLQAFINIAAMVGLIPLTGIPLPFISYGGTALMSAMAGAGILINISKNH